ncbi:hypothetical protein ASPWEDRAFT_187921 [Aspergillus wentii DTO 134E9]|uniref:Uncharacterized protein n=1 Tax=Aspergillus wentii DTO 134E9 TaxID=1073089 RepID=A0A1L9R6I4_ASPWE|nr:uncharacterized protein ASPWEDRAFT_187921 [Aspergillus wentii DTO 134E9]OJJ30535.1 hypothetical protein ASPWEDRAFT_187921 [Aspergillus wentii DTO 134E9]
MKTVQSVLLALGLLSSNCQTASADQQRLAQSHKNPLGTTDCRVTNDPVGGDDVPACEGYPSSPTAKVVRISGWADWYPPGTKDQYVVQYIGLQWSSGQIKWCGPKVKPQAYLNLAPNETITGFVVSGGTMVDSIKVTTSKGQNFSVGGDGGEAHDMDLGNGYMVGWDGFCLPELLVGFAPTFFCDEVGESA